MRPDQVSGTTEDTLAGALRTGDEGVFAALVERYRHQLHVHCYRMLGSVEDADDLVQETLLRAWRGRARFEGRSSVQTWLYRIATNACLNALERAPRRVLPQDVVDPITATSDGSHARESPPWAPEIPWLQPYPDRLLDVSAPPGSDPEALAISREFIELVFIAALQHLPPRQRAILVLRDVLDWSAKETSAHMGMTVASVNSAHQRARSTMRVRLPTDRSESSPTQTLSDEERATLQTFMDAWERADPVALTSLLREDVRWAMPPARLWFHGKQAVVRLLDLFPIDLHGRRFRLVPVGANRQPAAATYMRSPAESAFHSPGLHVLRVVDGQIAEITTFGAELCQAFELPATA